MKIFNTVVIAGALLAVPMSAARAGPCAAEIDSVNKLMGARDAGAGPTTGAGGAAVAQPAAPRAQHPPTAIIGQQTQGEATSPQDVQSQNRGGPTAAEQAQGAGGPLRRRSLQHKRRSRRPAPSIGPARRPSAWTLSGVQRGSWDSVSDKTSARSHGWSAPIVNSQTVRPVRRVLPPRGPCSERCRPSVC